MSLYLLPPPPGHPVLSQGYLHSSSVIVVARQGVVNRLAKEDIELAKFHQAKWHQFNVKTMVYRHWLDIEKWLKMRIESTLLSQHPNKVELIQSILVQCWLNEIDSTFLKPCWQCWLIDAGMFVQQGYNIDWSLLKHLYNNIDTISILLPVPFTFKLAGVISKTYTSQHMFPMPHYHVWAMKLTNRNFCLHIKK